MSDRTIKVMFTDLNRPFNLSNITNLFEWRMASRRHRLELSEKPDFLFYSCTGNEHLKYDCARIFYTPENIRPRFDRCDYAFSFDYPITERNYRLPLYRRWPEYGQLFNVREPEKVILQNRKFCSFMVSNSKAVERIEFFNRLSSYKRVDSGGRFLNNIGQPIQRGYDHKLDWMRNYKFSITFENSSYPGYTTEKLMHALITDTIPIYWGNPLAGLDFNPKAFINCHDYKTFNEVVELVKEIDHNDSLYREYLSQPYLKDNIETEFCKEGNILARYDQIFSSQKIFVAPIKKKLQKGEYYLAIIRKVFTKANRIFSVHSKHALHKLGIQYGKKSKP